MKRNARAKKVFLILGVSVALLLAITVIVLKTSTYEVVPPDRAPGIPADHEWYGGVDGGNWIRCEPQNDLKEFQCSMYSESGSFETKGLYLPSRPIVPPYVLSFGGGGYVYLIDQQKEDLVALKAEGWIEDSKGKTLYKNGERVNDL